jgi:hypothetical protein
VPTTSASLTVVEANETRRAMTASLMDHVRHELGLTLAAPLSPLTPTLVRLAAAHQVDGVLDISAATAHGEPGTDDLLRRQLHAGALRSLKLRMRLRCVLEAFAREGLPVLTFKGAALAAQTGRAPEGRAGSDVDVLIQPEHWVDAHRILLGLGHEMTECPEPGHDQRTRYVQWCYYEAPYRHRAGDVDLHWRVVMGHLPGMTAAALWRDRVEVDLAGEMIPTFHPDAALAHVALHGAKDRWIALRSAVDAHLLLEHGASWEGAQRRVPRGRALPECRAAVDFLRSGSALPHPAAVDAEHERSWVVGIVERPGFEDDARPTGGSVRSLRNRIRITPNLMSVMSVIALAAVPPDSLTKPAVPARWWWLGILTRFGRLLRRRAIIAGRRIGLPLAPPPSR